MNDHDAAEVHGNGVVEVFDADEYVQPFTDARRAEPDHEYPEGAGHALWSLISEPGTIWCRTCQKHFSA